MSSDYSAKVIKIHSSDQNYADKTFIIESFRESRRLEEIRTYILKNIDKIIEKSWGKFGKGFIIQHILRADRIKIIRDQEEIIAIAAASVKNIFNRQILYLEFTAIDPRYQGYNLSTKLNASMIQEEFFRGLFSRKLKPLDVFTITRNLRVIGSLSNFATYIYPNPKKFEQNGKLDPANNETWKFVQEILKTSWNPQRKLLREGSVLIGSYEDTPWLILPSTQRHYRQSVKELGEQYLHLGERSDREFIVHVKYSIFSILKYIVNVWKKNSTQKDAPNK